MKRLFLVTFVVMLCIVSPAMATPPTFVGKLGETIKDWAVGSYSSIAVSGVVVSAGSNRLLKVSISDRGTGSVVTSCTFGAANLSVAGTSYSGAINSEVWVLESPAVSTDTVTCNFSPNARTGRVTVYQYNDSGGIGATNTNVGSSNAPSVTVTTTQADSFVFASVFHASQTGSPFAPAAGTTERTDAATGTDTTNDRSFTDLEKTTTTAGAYTPSTTAGASNNWSVVGVEIKGIVAAGAGPGLLTLLGVGGPSGAAPPPSGDCTIEMAPGSTDAQILAQIAAAADGSKLCIAPGETVIVSNVLQMDISQRALTLDCQGSTLQRNKTGPLILMQGSEVGTSAFTVSGQTITWATVPSGLAVGDWVKLSADDDLPGASHASATLRARLGQAVQITSVSGLTTNFVGTLNFSSSYLTNRRGNKIQSKQGVTRRCRILGNAAQTTWVEPSIQVINAVSPLIEQVQVEQGLAGGVDFVNTVSAVLRGYDGRNLLTSSTGQNYLAHTDASWNTQASGGYAENTQQPFAASTKDILANTVSLANYGAAWNVSLTDTVCRTATGVRGCFGLDAEAQFAVIERVYGIDGSRCVSMQGRNNTLKNSFCINMTNGLELNDASGGGSAQGLLFDRYIMREIDNIGLTVSGTGPTNNRICSSRIESYVAAEAITESANLSSCTYVSGQATLFNTTLASNVPNDQENLACQTCDDIIPAGNGNDTIDALGGNDLINGGPGNDTITTGPGRDSIQYLWTDEDFDGSTADDADTVTDFTVGAAGDIIDISPFVARAAGADYTGNPFTDGYARSNQSGGDCQIQLDIDGGGNGYVTVATLTGITCANLVSNGSNGQSDNWRTRLRQ